MHNPFPNWIHGSADCATNADPPLQIHRFDADTVILRENKCLNAEGNFLYLLFGARRALLLDTGAAPPPGKALPLRETVDRLVAGRLAERGTPSEGFGLVVAHTHSHSDHAAGDGQFRNRPDTTIVPPVLEKVQEFFGFTGWPEGLATLDLGGRALGVFPIPGHEAAHVAVYDPNATVLLTGDTLYPGVLTVEDFPAYRRSAARLADFVSRNPVSLVLGAHVEMKRQAGQFYDPRTAFQPDEHVLQLFAAHADELHQACEAMADPPREVVRDEFVIEPF